MAKMPSAESEVTTPDGSLDFSGGVDSLTVPTLQSQENPNGLPRNELAWLINATVRDGGISPRAGWNKNGTIMAGNTLFQGSYMYEPLNGNPYIVASLGGQIFQIDPNSGTATNLSVQFNCFNPPSQPKAYFVQAEQFLVIQAGDNLTLPLFWDGAILRRSAGITSAQSVPASVTIENVDDSANVGKTVPAGSYFANISGNDLVIQNYAAFVLPAVGATVNISDTATGVPNGTLPSPTFTLPLRTSVTIKNVNDSANVGKPVPAGPLVSHTGQTPSQGNTSNSGFTMINYDGFTVPAVGGSVTILCDSISITNQPVQYPTTQFNILNPGQGGWEITFTQTHQSGHLQITAITNASTTAGTVEIPAATAMDYYMGRLWYAQGRNYCAGDIVDGPSGTLQYNFNDSVLKVTENPLVVGGDGFTVPSNAGIITAIFHNANINESLGQGRLFIATQKSVYSLQVPVTRTDWINANNQNQPLQVVVQKANGAVNDWSVVSVNSDDFFQSNEPAIRSLQQAIRYFGQWGNAQVSANVNRILKFTNTQLMMFESGIYFDNRLLQTSLPTQLPQGVVHPALVVLDFMPVSTFGITTQAGTIANPVWEGSYEGLQVLQLLTGNFGNQQRAFAITVSTIDSSFELWEITTNGKVDGNDNRITYQVEFPAFTWGEEFGLKRLVGGELWVDKLFGTVEFTMEYRVDGNECWLPWHKWKECSSRSSAEDIPPSTYPVLQHGPGYRQTMTLPIPPSVCSTQQNRPSDIGFQFQPRLTVKGYTRLRGILLYAQPVDRKLYTNQIC